MTNTEQAREVRGDPVNGWHDTSRAREGAIRTKLLASLHLHSTFLEGKPLGISVGYKAGRSRRWSGGYPRLLQALVLEFESHSGEVLNLFEKYGKKRINC